MTPVISGSSAAGEGQSFTRMQPAPPLTTSFVSHAEQPGKFAAAREPPVAPAEAPLAFSVKAMPRREALRSDPRRTRPLLGPSPPRSLPLAASPLIPVGIAVTGAADGMSNLLRVLW
jgi:hypothetical protein